ncbi:hypothetical protein LRP49_02240 [Enterovibrio sp. ZSDZ35]|uniref:Porin n=1 Tax=Enterovibrio qingdaonensis TaxID=2899818 RepID=A0ABT5QGC7_9GAMM|nr:hypothetical protein [Enterovibrio sp. ZSDZ35]MDD1780007.1 hypothetical protein [Enterovibrio sp. ZSDZ35]
MFLTRPLNSEKERKGPRAWRLWAVFIASASLAQTTWATSLTGEISFGYLQFWETPESLTSNQTHLDMIPRIHSDLSSDALLTIEPALRVRSHSEDSPFFDPYKSRLAVYLEQWEITMGYDIVFWGASEGAQILDILNQRDLGSDFDGDTKIGQPLISASGYLGDGLASVYYLPYTPKRRFRSNKERLSSGFSINSDHTQWQDDQDAYYPGFAARYAYSFDSVDIALVGFHGINREPAFLLEASQFSPIYAVGTQLGLEVQWIAGNMLTKLEVLNTSKAPTQYGYFEKTTQYVIGGEYTSFDVLSSGIDIRWVGEYVNNTLGEELLSLYQHDLLLAMHTSFNDVDTTQLSLSLLHDMDHHSNILEATLTRRLNQNIELSLSLFDFSSLSPSDFFFGLESDSYGEMMVTYYF